MLKHFKQDAADRLREQGPRARKTLSRSAIKKNVRERFKVGKNFIDVQDYKGDWKRVVGPRWHRVYIAINDAKRIRQESTRPFYGKKAWLVQVGAFLQLSHVHCAIDFLVVFS